MRKKPRNNQEITEVQREAYKDYLSKIDRIASEIPLLMLAYYKEHYEDIERRWQLDDDLKIDVVDKNVLLNGFDLKKIFIDRNGNYGWLVEFIWDDIPDAMLTYYLQNYEDIEEWCNIPQKYNKQNVNRDSVMELIRFNELYFDEEGTYGWLCGCPWDSAGIAILLSGEEIEITVQDELI